jgi:predicted secreted protein
VKDPIGIGAEMSNKLQDLLRDARKVQMTSAEREQQRRSFAYGNTKIENERITMATIERAAKDLAEQESD